MKRLGSVVILGLFLLSAFSVALVALPSAPAVHAAVSPNTVATDGNVYGTYDAGDLTFYANGYYWAFFVNSTSNHEEYASSSSGSSWSAPATITSSCNIGADPPWSYAVSGTTVYRVCSGSTDVFYVDSGTLGSGTITWGTEIGITKVETSSSTAMVATAIDSSGNWWVATYSYDGTNYHVETWKCSSSCLSAASWSNSNVVTNSGGAQGVLDLTALPSGALSVVSEASGSHLWGETYNGSAWAGPFTSTGTIGNFNGYCAAIGTTTDCVADSTGPSYATLSSSGTWSSVTSLYSCGTGTTSYEGISSDGSSHLGVYFTCGGSSTYYMTSSNSGSTWSSVTTDSSSETDAIRVGCSLSTDSIGDMQCIWTSGSTSPYDIRFSDVNVYTPPACTSDCAVQPVTSSMADGATAANLILSGTGLNVTTIPSNGKTHYILMKNDTALTLTEPTDGSTSRYRFTGMATTETGSACHVATSGTDCTLWTAPTNYLQYSDTFKAAYTGTAPATGAPEHCSQAGSPATIGDLTTAGVSGYCDYGSVTSSTSTTASASPTPTSTATSSSSSSTTAATTSTSSSITAQSMPPSPYGGRSPVDFPEALLGSLLTLGGVFLAAGGRLR